MIAIVGDLYAVIAGSLNNCLPVLGLYLLPVESEFRHRFVFLTVIFGAQLVHRASNSLRNFVTKLLIGITSASAKGQIVLPSIISTIFNKRSRSDFWPFPATMFFRILAAQPVPSRQGVHWPQDSW